MATVESIELTIDERIDELQKSLKKMSSKWARRLAKKMKCKSYLSIYNYTNGSISSNEAKMKFLIKGNELLDELKEEQQSYLKSLPAA